MANQQKIFHGSGIRKTIENSKKLRIQTEPKQKILQRWIKSSNST